MNEESKGPVGSAPEEEATHRLENLRRRLEQLSGGKVFSGGDPEGPPGLQEQFLQRVLEHEQLPRTTPRAILAGKGYHFAPPESVSEPELSDRLWELLRALAESRIYLECTDHLSDRELYVHLWEEVLPAEDVYFPDDADFACFFDVIGSGSESDAHLYLKHYADDFWRRSWSEEFPEDEMPEHEDPPYDRDRLLPRP